MNWKIILAAGAILFSGALYAQPITVPDDYSTIQLAINAAVPGDTVYVRAGTYPEHVIISKPLTLQGEDRETTVIDGGGTGDVILINSHYVTVGGLNITDGVNGISMGHYIHHLTIQDVIVDYNSEVGIGRYSTRHTRGNWLIEDCIVAYNGMSVFKQMELT